MERVKNYNKRSVWGFFALNIDEILHFIFIQVDELENKTGLSSVRLNIFVSVLNKCTSTMLGEKILCDAVVSGDSNYEYIYNW